MKKLILLLSLSLALTACGGSDNHPPEGAVGLWVDTIDANTADNLNSFSLNNGECAYFSSDSASAEFVGTFIEENGDMYNLTTNEFGTFTDDSPLGFMDSDGFVSLNLTDEALEFGVVPEIRFEMTGVDSAISIATFNSDSLSVEEQELTDLIKINPDEFAYFADRVVRFCTR